MAASSVPGGGREGGSERGKDGREGGGETNRERRERRESLTNALHGLPQHLSVCLRVDGGRCLDGSVTLLLVNRHSSHTGCHL